MLKTLTIQNYALIDYLSIEFSDGFSTITGETGAGKSILLGALSLLVGQRADTDILLDKTRKCYVEAIFEITAYHLEAFFEQHEIDYSNDIIIRREILENGRSRAFVNDTPVNLSVLKELGEKLVDIHSQHQNSFLTDWNFQLKIIDIIANNQNLLSQYKESFRRYHDLKKQITELKDLAHQGQKELDYLQFQFNELEQAKLKRGEQAELEENFKVLSNAEEIKQHLNNVYQLLLAEDYGVVLQIKESITQLNKTKNFFHKVESLLNRLESVYIEMKDIANELEQLNDSVDVDPERLEFVRQRLDFLYSLCQKHKVTHADELIEVHNTLRKQLSNIQSYGELIASFQLQLDNETTHLKSLGEQLHLSRQNIIPAIEQKVILLLQQLGMPNAQFVISLEILPDFQSTGLNAVTFLFSANRQVEPQELSRIASGGEISRVMLALKSIIASSLAMPTVIFDEIDSGVSGEIADKMGTIMKEMALNMQVISITHLPQVAAKGSSQYLVYKIDNEKGTSSHIKRLSSDERIVEIAKMLSGKQVTEAAISNARVLLTNQ